MSLSSPYSLRTRLLWVLLLAISATALIQGGLAYRSALADADQLFDYHMQQMAMSLSGGLPDSGLGPPAQALDEAESTDFVVQVWTSEGLRVFESATRAVLPQRAVIGFSDVEAAGSIYRVFSLQSRSHVIQIAQDMAIRREMASALALRTVLPIAIMAPLLMLLVWWSVSTSLRPVARVRQQLAQRQPDTLDEISAADLPEEIRPLVQELNLLFVRVREAFEAQKNFVADAAHELRSPLAALKLQALGIQRAADDATREVAVQRLGAGVDRATRLVEQLMVLARQQATTAMGVKPQPASLAELARLAIAEMAPAAQARHIDLGLGCADEGQIAAYPDALHILLRNLLDNAIKYTPEGGTIDLEVCHDADVLRLSVDDSGPGIAEADRERVFDRFYRLAGSQATGSGLGLSIVKTIARLHGATLRIDRSERLGGLRMELSFQMLA